MQSPTTTPTALLLIDLQLGLLHPPHEIRTLETNIALLLSTARTHNTTNPTTPIHIIHVHHHSITPSSQLHPSYTMTWDPYTGHKGTDAMPCAAPAPGEPVLTKSVNSAFVGTGLEGMLRGLGVKQIVVVGMTTEHCVSSTVRMAANLNVVGEPGGFGERGVVLVEDGCACYGKVGADGRVWEAEVVHAVEIECLRGEFATVVRTEEAVEVICGVEGK